MASVNGTHSRSGLSRGSSWAGGSKFSLYSSRSTLSSCSRLTIGTLWGGVGTGLCQYLVNRVCVYVFVC